MTAERWTQCTPSEYAWERAALTYLKNELPDGEPYRAWTNAEFIGSDGSINEIDLLLVTPGRIVLLEVKSWSGTVVGDAGTWRQLHRAPVDNPVIAVNRKARKLKTLLAAQPALRGRQVPWIQGAVFLSDARLDVRGLSPEGRAHVYGRRDQSELPSVLGFLTQPGSVDAPTSQAVGRAVQQAGIRHSQRGRTVGNLRLQMPPFQEGPGWQDFLAHHQRFPDDPPRRVRIYLAAEAGETRTRLLRAAEREYRALRGIDHPGIPRPVDFVDHDLGPALVFPHDPDLVRLDHFLQQDGARLSFDERLALVRALAETMAYAHRRVLMHRGLSPRSVWVRRDGDEFVVHVTDWQMASRGDTGTGTAVTATRTFADLVEQGATAYFAPDWAWNTTNGIALDVFGVGAIAYHVFAGHSPASSYSALSRRLQMQGRLSLRQQVDAVPAELDSLVADATQADPAKRTRDLAALLLDLDLVRERLRAPDETPTEVVDPLHAQAGDELENGLRVVHRLGRGSTALALLVERDGERAVLKVSLDPDKDVRLRSEAGALTTVGAHPGIVELLDEPMLVGQRLAILLSSAGELTLAQELRERGRLQPEWLHDWGDDLLEIVDHLERRGVAHRDIKPDNLGVAERAGKGKKRELVLFDFSLAGEPLDAVDAGTPPYLDPFLGRPDRRVWDTAAERYAAAVTLYEMATARRPEYGSAGGHPGFGDADVTIDAELFDRSYAAGLADFFSRALHRDARKRFDTAEEMRRAWDEVFAAPSAGVREERAGPLTRDTPVGAARLSPPVLAVLERLEVTTVGAAGDLSPAQVAWLPGIGSKTRVRLRTELSRLADEVTSATETANELTLLDEVAASLVPKPEDRDVAEALLGLGEPDAQGHAGNAWTTVRDVAWTLGRDQGQVRDVVGGLEGHWAGLPSMRDLRDALVEVVESVGGVASGAQCAGALVDRLGSTVEEPLRSRVAEAVVRAAIDAELADEQLDGDPRLVYSREPRGILVASGPLRVGDGPSTAERLEWAARLGEAADELAGSDPLPVPARVMEVLRKVPAPPGTDLAVLPADRLLELAVTAAKKAETTPRLEVYPNGLDAGRALRLAAGALYGVADMTAEQVAQRVAERFPEAAPLPGRPELDGLIEDAGVPLRWSEDDGRYVARRPEVTGLTALAGSGTTRPDSTGGATAGTAWRSVDDPVLEVDTRLARSLDDGGWLVLTASLSRLARAEGCLAGHDVRVVDVERVLLDGMRAFCRQRGVHWDVVLAADAAERTSGEWVRLGQVVRAGLDGVRAAIEAAGPAVLLVNAGVLARYDRSLTLLAELRESLRRATAASRVRTVWLLVPWADRQKPPMLDGAAVPVFGSQWLPLPGEWVRRHAAAQKVGGAA
ncbi:MAG: BREX system serine/threonine kinase PglW [Actinomycetes bacterium]